DSCFTAGSGRAAGGWNTTCGGWNTAAGTAGAGVMSPAPGLPVALSCDSLSYSSLSSIRAISSQAPGRAETRTARELVVNVGPGGTARAVLSARGHRAGSAAPGRYLCLHGYGALVRPCRPHDVPLPASRARGPWARRV